MWQIVIHHRENRLLDFSRIAGTAYEYGLLGIVDDDEDLTVHPVDLGVGLKVWGVQDDEIILMGIQFIFTRSNEHVAGESRVPGIL